MLQVRRICFYLKQCWMSLHEIAIPLGNYFHYSSPAHLSHFFFLESCAFPPLHVGTCASTPFPLRLTSLSFPSNFSWYANYIWFLPSLSPHGKVHVLFEIYLLLPFFSGLGAFNSSSRHRVKSSLCPQGVHLFQLHITPFSPWEQPPVLLVLRLIVSSAETDASSVHPGSFIQVIDKLLLLTEPSFGDKGIRLFFLPPWHAD